LEKQEKLKQALAKENADLRKEMGNIVEQHNKLVISYNDLGKQHNALGKDHNDLMTKYNTLVKKYNDLATEGSDPTLGTFLTAKAMRAYHHPGIEGAANKTFIHVLPLARPMMQRGQVKSAMWFNHSKDTVHTLLQDWSPESAGPWLPAASGFLVYGSVLFPAVFAFKFIADCVCSFKYINKVGHFYFAGVSLSGMAFAGYTGVDPLATYFDHDIALYQFSQLAFAVLFVAYYVVACLALACECRANRCFMILILSGFFAVYFYLVWTPAMVDEAPQLKMLSEYLYPGKDMPGRAAIPYCLATLCFATVYLLEVSTEDGDSKKKVLTEEGSSKAA
jgi:hypothetical protein